MTDLILRATSITKQYRLPRRSLFEAPAVRLALDSVSLALRAGERLGIVGESGSGKSTLGRIIVGLERSDSGEFWISPNARPQMVFQDPFGSLDPRQRIERIISEPLHAEKLSRTQSRDRVVKILGEVGLRSDVIDRYPHQFSGGQRQRIAIARSLISEPNLLCADEPVSALDVSVQAQVLNLLSDICAARQLALVMISHDLSVVAHMCERIVVMRNGQVVEEGETLGVLSDPSHTYTRALRDSVLPSDPARARQMLRG